MDHSHSHGDMDMSSDGASSGASCFMSMLWNWNTIDTCLISNDWHIRSEGMFAGSVIGVFILAIAIEGVRRLGREYDRKLVLDIQTRAFASANIHNVATSDSAAPLESPSPSDENKNKDAPAVCAPIQVDYTPSIPQQVLRSIAYGSQFTAAFFLMLLGMYFNGYILFAVFLGQAAGFLAFGRDTATIPRANKQQAGCC